MSSHQAGDQGSGLSHPFVQGDNGVIPQQQLASSLAAAAAAAAAVNPNVSAGGYPAFDLGKFWQEEMHQANVFESDFKNHPLPLARIKKVMKTDEDVKMISAEVPVLFSKGCEIFITELTKRAWVHAEENKRRTLQRSDIATAVSKTDMCDFLIDIVPREETAKSQPQAFDQPEYASYYAQGGVPSFSASQTMDPAAYYNDQVQQYQLHFQQQFANQQPQPSHQHPQAQQPQQQPQPQQQQQQQQQQPQQPQQQGHPQQPVYPPQQGNVVPKTEQL